MNPEVLNEIAGQMIARYSGRYNELGYNVKSLGWGTVEQQFYRFKQTFEGIDFSHKPSILDIGCGFGDYLAAIRADAKEIKEYRGWDITTKFIEEAANIWSKQAFKATFEVQDVSSFRAITPIADAGVMLGVLNLNLCDKNIDNYEYSARLIANAYSCVKSVLIVDFLSDKLNPDYPKEDFVFYHNPARMLDFALSLSSKVILKHDYAPIPQREFMLFIYK